MSSGPWRRPTFLAGMAGLALLVIATGSAFIAGGMQAAVNVAQLAALAATIASLATGLTLWYRRSPARDARDSASPAGRLQTRNALPSTMIAASATEADPLRLGVRQALPPPGLGSPPGSPTLTPYFERPHDAELRQALKAAEEEGSSVLAVLIGQSSTGKTRALLEAVREVCPARAVLYPGDTAGLLAVLDMPGAGAELPAAVIWLNDIHQFLFGEPGARAATRLTHLLATVPGTIAVGTIWPNYWDEFTTRDQPHDPTAAARTLLESPQVRRIAVSDHFDAAQLAALRRDARDPRLKAALDAGGAHGRVIQHLTGGPELLDAFSRPHSLYRPVEHALIAAALDARRLGHQAPLPAALLADAADGYLLPDQRPGDPHWAADSLEAITTGRRPDHTRTDIRGTLTALTTFRTRSGQATASYEPDDYLDQNARRARQSELGPARLWDALVRHTVGADDLDRLAGSAERRGLYRHAALAYLKAVAAGSTSSVAPLLRLANESGRNGGAVPIWVAGHMKLDAPGADITELLRTLRAAGETDAVTTLLGRAPARHIPLTVPENIAWLLHALDGPLAESAIAELMRRDLITDVPLEDARGLGSLIRELKEVRAEEQAAELARRAALHVQTRHPGKVARLLYEFGQAGAEEAVDILLARDPASGVSIDDPGDVAAFLRELAEVSRDATAHLLARDPGGHAALGNSHDVAYLVEELQAAGDDAAAARLACRAAQGISLTDAGDLAVLLHELRQLGRTARDATALLLGRIHDRTAPFDDTGGAASLMRELRLSADNPEADKVAETIPVKLIPLDNPSEIASLMRELRTSGNTAAMQALLDRDPGGNTSLDEQSGVEALFRELTDAGAQDQAEALRRRAADAGHFRAYLRLAANRTTSTFELARYGRDPDRGASQAWDWDKLIE
jgi:hypothetical protein